MYLVSYDIFKNTFFKMFGYFNKHWPYQSSFTPTSILLAVIVSPQPIKTEFWLASFSLFRFVYKVTSK